MLAWIEAKRWRITTFIVVVVVVAVIGGVGLWSAINGKKDADQALTTATTAVQQAAGTSEPGQAPDQNTTPMPALRTDDPYIERASQFVAEALTWTIDNYRDEVRPQALGWAANDQAREQIAAILPDIDAQTSSIGHTGAAWRTGADEVTLRVRQSVTRPTAAGNAHGAADHLVVVHLDEAGQVTSVTVTWARGKVG